MSSIRKQVMETLTGWLERVRIKRVERYRRRDAEFLPAALEIVESPPAHASRVVLWTLFSLAAVAALWLVFGSVEEVTAASGKVIPGGYVRTLQAEDKGVVTAVYVSEGQPVKQGDLLLEMDPTVATAEVQQLKKKTAGLRLEAERLRCEKEGRPFNPATEPDAEPEVVRTQRALYRSRQLAQQARSGEALQSVTQGQAEFARSLAERQRQLEMLEYAQQKTEKLKYLLEQNAISELSVLEQNMRRQELQRELEAQQAAVDAQRAALAQRQNTALRTVAEYGSDVDAALAETLGKLGQAEEELKKALVKKEFCRVVAPEDGFVANLAVHAGGAVVVAAQTLLEVVPQEDAPQVEAWVSNKDIGFIRTGQAAELKVQTFAFQKYGTVPARVVSVSPNALDDPQQGRVFRVLLQPQRNAIDVDGRMVRLGSGMTVSAEIQTRTKKIYEYFLEPFRKYASEAMRER